MLPMILAAVVALAVPVGEEDGPRYLAVVTHVFAQDRVNYSPAYGSIAEAESAAEKIALCGFWRVDFGSLRTSLVAAGAVQEIHLIGIEEAPPVALGGPNLPPPPDVERIVDCPAWRARRPGPAR